MKKPFKIRRSLIMEKTRKQRARYVHNMPVFEKRLQTKVMYVEHDVNRVLNGVKAIDELIKGNIQ